MPRLLLAIALAAILAPAALAQTCTTSWASATGGSWDDPTNWTNGVPGSATGGSAPCITIAGTYTVEAGGADRSFASLTLGSTSGAQTLTTAGQISVGSATVGPRGRWAFQNRTPGGQDGLYATGVVLVEGEVSVPGGVSFLPTGGTLDVASAGAFRVGTGASVGGVSSLFRIRGKVEGVGCPPDNTGECQINAPVEVLGGTLRAVDGNLVFRAGGTMNGATLDAGPAGYLGLNSDLVEPYRMTAEGLIQGSPQGAVGLSTLNLFAGPAGATLAVGGTGLQLFRSNLRSDGGVFTNTGLLKEGLTGSNFSSFGAVTVRNLGTVEFTSSFEFSGGAVLRNEPGATVLFSAGGDLSGTGRFDNAGLLLREGNRPGIGPTVRLSGLLRSLPGSEIRIGAGTAVDLDAPGSESLPAGVAVTGTGTVGIPFTLDPEGTFSPGTEAQPLAALTVATYFRPSLVAGDPRLVIDIESGGRSDTLVVPFSPGSQNTRLGGTLVVRARPDYLPRAGDTFTVLTSGSAIDGAFSAVVVEGAPGAAAVSTISDDGRSVVVMVTVGVAGEEAPAVGPALTATSVSSPSPQPSVRISLSEPVTLVVDVFDAQGRRVARLAEGRRPAGIHTLPVAGLAPGVYVARVVAVGPAGTHRATQRLVVVR